MTTLFGLDEAEVRELASAVSETDAADTFARSTWLVLAVVKWRERRLG